MWPSGHAVPYNPRIVNQTSGNENDAMKPWLETSSIDIDLDQPLETRYRNIPDEELAKGRRLLRAIMQEFPAGSGLLADMVRLRTRNRFHKEIVALSRQVGVGWREICLANVSYDLALSIIGCSTIALPTPDGPVVARNMDWWPEEILAQTSTLVRCHRGDQLAFAIAGWPGSVGVVTGLSARGFCIVLNAVLCEEGIDKTGYPVLLHIRRVLEDADGFDQALEMLSEQHLAAPALLTLVGTENHQRVVIERSPKRCALRRPEGDAPLVTTNDYRKLYKPAASDAGEIYQTTCDRHDALSRYFADHDTEQTVEDARLLYILSEPDIIQNITAQHVVMRPRSGQIRLFVPRRLLPAA